MSSSQWQDELTPILRQMQVVAAGLALGCLAFLVVTLVVPVDRPQNEAQPILTYVALAFAVIVLVARLIVVPAVTSSSLRKISEGTWQPQQARSVPRVAQFLERTGDAGKLALVFMTRTIIGGAMLEGPAFFLLIAYMFERRPLSLIAAGALILGLLFQIPSRGRLVAWIEEQLQLIDQQRQFR